MKIRDIETIILRLPEVLPNGDGLQDVLIIRVHTDAGIVGLGEVHTSPLVAKTIIDAPISQLTVQGFIIDLRVNQGGIQIRMPEQFA